MNLNPAVAAHIQSMPWDDFCRKIGEITDSDMRKAALRYRFRTDRPAYLKYCFPVLFGRPFNRYHKTALARPKLSVRERRGRDTYRADAAPRGIAKTTLVKGDIFHDIDYGLEDFIVVVSREMRLAIEITSHIRDVFLDKDNPHAKLYGPFVVTGGVSSFSVTTPNGHRTAVLARSFGTQIRGANDQGRRPTKIIIDDGEHPKRVLNPTLRREDQAFLNDDIMSCGPIDKGLTIEWRGTVLHRDAILSNLLKNDGWEGSLWKACESWPDRMDLWNDCAAIYRDLSLGNERERYDCAYAFYEAHREDMDAGAKMLDDVAFPLFAFFHEQWVRGLRSVLRERQNEPDTAGTKYFERESFGRCKVVGDKRTGGYIIAADGRRVDMADLRVFARLDPIPGKELGQMGDEGGAGAGDYAALVILARDPNGGGYVVDAWMKRARDSEQRAALWAYGEKWQVEKATIESNGFQRLIGREFRREQVSRRDRGEFWQMNAEDDVSSENKENRIASLEGPISSKFLQFSDALNPDWLGQFEAFPEGDHDDFPDAVEGAWRLSSLHRVQMSQAPIQSLERIGLRRG